MRSFRLFLAPALFFAVASQSACQGNQQSRDRTVLHEGGDEGCTFTQGFWKNHPEDWPVTELLLGDRLYTQAELLAIFHLEVSGNGLVSMSHQLIAAKLNVAAGAPDAEISAEIIAADDLIADLVVPPVGTGFLDPSVTSALNDALEEYNSEGPEDCNPPAPVCGDGTVDAGEECDDGNTASGDGCSATCEEEEPAPVCGDGTVDAGEECDDGNTTSGDGCSARCEEEEPAPDCGDGTVDAGEQCDDGNTTSGDGCSASCQIEVPAPVCGNGVVEVGEQCDDGNSDNNDECSTSCRIITG